MLKSLKIPLAFLATGIIWVILIHPIITLLTAHNFPHQDIIRDINDLIFVIIITYVLYHEINKQQRQLARSEAEYRQLFESNPNPMWIYRESDLRFIKVNDAAVDMYGYSRMRFLRMKVEDIRPADEQINFLNDLKNSSEQIRNAGLWQHKKANNEIFIVGIIAHPVVFNKERCKMVLINDMTDIIQKEQKLHISYQKLKLVNQTLSQVNWSNSHELRRPICSLLGLINLLESAETKEDYIDTYKMVKKCVIELDTITRTNNKKVSDIKPWDKG